MDTESRILRLSIVESPWVDGVIIHKNEVHHKHKMKKGAEAPVSMQFIFVFVMPLKSKKNKITRYIKR
jgi:hypothetical protein